MTLVHNLKVSCLFFIALLSSSLCADLHPVVLVPGDGGAQLEAKLNKTNVVHYICEKTSDYFNIWLNMELLVPVVIDCWVDNIKLIYDNVTRKTHDAPGVDVRVPGFGSSETVEWLDPSHASTGAYFKDIGNILVTLGHVRNITIKGAPYDFRKAPSECCGIFLNYFVKVTHWKIPVVLLADENQDYFVKLKQLVEDTYTENENKSVMLIAHSMGGPMSLYFLNQQAQDWKDKYIKSLVTLSGAWGGSVKAVKVYAIGERLDEKKKRFIEFLLFC